MSVRTINKMNIRHGNRLSLRELTSHCNGEKVINKQNQQLQKQKMQLQHANKEPLPRTNPGNQWL